MLLVVKDLAVTQGRSRSFEIAPMSMTMAYVKSY